MLRYEPSIRCLAGATGLYPARRIFSGQRAAAAISAAGLAGTPVAFSDAYDSGSAISIRPYTAGSLVGAVFAELGLENAWQGIEGDPAYGLGATDVEGLTTLGDVPFWYMASDSTPDPYADGLAGNAIDKSDNPGYCRR